MLMTTAAAAQSLNVTDRCIRKWCAAGRLRAQRLGGRWLIYPSSITALKNIA
ncbi:MAG: DNA-binding protein [Mycolicibacter arupensis]|nr:helix-turn-helix domain-containing protein [Mycolicibacter arupensis]TXI60029.1 MAG: DNA-binding protein [Mycolicibacter arupensis]